MTSVPQPSRQPHGRRSRSERAERLRASCFGLSVSRAEVLPGAGQDGWVGFRDSAGLRLKSSLLAGFGTIPAQRRWAGAVAVIGLPDDDVLFAAVVTHQDQVEETGRRLALGSLSRHPADDRQFALGWKFIPSKHTVSVLALDDEQDYTRVLDEELARLDEDGVKDWVERLKGMQRDLPEGGEPRLTAIREMLSAYREQIIRDLQPVIRDLLQDNPPSDLDEMKRIAVVVNGALQDCGLAIRFPGGDEDALGRPAIVLAKTSPTKPEGWLILEAKRKSWNDAASRTVAISRIGPLELIACARNEAISRRRP